tara:strand:- start:1140 stop:1436 length:297 start_codon:yes stop_codon:yes gene_type:complete
MNELFEYLNKKDITLSIAVYPLPYQIKYDNKNSINVQIWKEFCKIRCKNFINTHETFFDLKSYHSDDYIVDKYYIKNDVQFNRWVSEILADDFIKYEF